MGKASHILSKNLKALRGSRSIYQVAKDTGFTYSYLHGLENDKKSNPTLTKIEILADYYEVKVCDLFTEE